MTNASVSFPGTVSNRKINRDPLPSGKSLETRHEQRLLLVVILRAETSWPHNVRVFLYEMKTAFNQYGTASCWQEEKSLLQFLNDEYGFGLEK